MTREDPQMKVRLPEELRDRIFDEAKANGRSMNAEIIARLIASFSAEEAAQPSKIAIREVVMETTGQVIRSVLEAFDAQPKDRRDNIEEIIIRAGSMLDKKPTA